MLGLYGTFQIAIADLEAVTGFGALKAADPLKKTEAESVVPIGTPWIWCYIAARLQTYRASDVTPQLPW